MADILGRCERKGFTLVGLRLLTPSRVLAEQHYGVQQERPFFGGSVECITSGSVVAMVWQGEGVIAARPSSKLVSGSNRKNSAIGNRQINPGALNLEQPEFRVRGPE